jgi:trans-aconitate methyltransferase
MNYYVLILLVSTAITHGTDFDAQAYAQGNFIQQNSALKIIAEYNIPLAGKTILDVGCGTGNITDILAQEALFIDGIDASPSMIAYAKEHYENKNNINFHLVSVEDFTPQKQYDLVVSFFCFHWIDNEKAAIQTIASSLRQGGLFVEVTEDGTNQTPIEIEIFKELQNEWSQKYPVQEIVGVYYDKSDENSLLTLEENGLSPIVYTTSFLVDPIKNHEELRKIYAFSFLSLPALQDFSQQDKEAFFDQFLNRLAKRLEKDEDGNLLLPTVIKIIIAQKQ